MRMTQKDIARALGVSLITVSRALNENGYVSQELKERILAFAQDNNYVPHKASQVLVRNKLNRIVLFSSSLPAYFWDDIGKGIDAASGQIRPFNYDVRYYTVPEADSESYVRILRQEIEHGANGFAFVNQRIYDMKQIFDIAERAGIPYVTFNVDAPESKRICYVGSDYEAGGRLAAEFIGKTIQFRKRAHVLVITTDQREDRYSDAPNINEQRLYGFRAVMHASYPHVTCEVESITTRLNPGFSDTQIFDLLRDRQGKVAAVYLTAALNATFLEALEQLDYRAATTVLHDIDSSALHHLETRLLTAVIYQNPILQGYYTVKMLEHILESKGPHVLPGVEIISNLILSENRNLYRNHALFIT